MKKKNPSYGPSLFSQILSIFNNAHLFQSLDIKWKLLVSDGFVSYFVLGGLNVHQHSFII